MVHYVLGAGLGRLPGRGQPHGTLGEYAGAQRVDSPLLLCGRRFRSTSVNVSGEEHFLVTQRVSWLLLSQSFLFIVYSALVVSKPLPRREAQATGSSTRCRRSA